MIGFLVVILLGGAVVIVRTYVTRRAHATISERLTIGADGVIVGAEPIDLTADGGRAVLLVHGFGDTPQTLEYLAAFLHSHGWSVRAPLLPGHGRTLDAFAASRATEWIECARDELAKLRARYETVAVIGLSMGGALATIIAAEAPDIRALVLLAPYLSMPARVRRAASLHSVLRIVLPYTQGGGEQSIHDPIEAKRNLAYGFTTPRLVFELANVVKRARGAAPFVAVPTLVIQSRQDNRIPPDAAERAFALFTVTDRRLLWTEGNGHVISVDYGRQMVFAAAAKWLDAHARTPTRDASREARRPHTT